MAAQIIDALLVTLGLDIAQFKKGHKEAQDYIAATKKTAADAAKKSEEDTRKSADTFSRLKGELLGVGMALLGISSLRGFADQLTAADSRLGPMAANLNSATKELSAWQGVMRSSGESAEGFTASYKGLVSALERYRISGEMPQALTYLRQGLGVDPLHADGRVKGIDEIMLSSAGPMQALAGRHGMAHAQEVGRMVGFDEGTVNVLTKGRAEVERMLMLQKQLGAATDEDSKKARERSQAWEDNRRVLEDLGRKILNDITPAIVGMAEAVRSVLSWLKENHRLVEALLLSLSALSAFKFIGLVASVAQLVTGLGAAALAARALQVAMGPIGWASLAIGAVGTGALWAWDKYKGGKEEKANKTGGANGAAAGMFAEIEQRNGLPPGLLDSMWAQESGRGKYMLSEAGAKGHFGFMPATAAQYGIAGQEGDLGASAGAAGAYMGKLLSMFGGDVSLALMAYNAGEGRIGSYLKGRGKPLAQETINYPQKVLARMAGGGGATVTSNTSIGSIIVHTKATDGAGVASELSEALRNQGLLTPLTMGAS